MKKDTQKKYTLNEAAAEMGRRGFEARKESQGMKVIQEQARENLEKAREKRWAE